MKKLKTVVSVIFISIVAVSAVFAGGSIPPNPETCKLKEPIDVTCSNCNTGKKIGVVSMAPEYDAKYGDCFGGWKTARANCAQIYNTPKKNISVKWKDGLSAWIAPSGCSTKDISGKTVGSAGGSDGISDGPRVIIE